MPPPYRTFVSEFLIIVAFVILTSLMTWPWILNLRNAVADAGDPYMIAWSLWWNFHQTFSDPLNLFHANVFYPYKYTLAFSENDFGIALLFFPLFAAGVKPLTVHSVATFLGFAFCGYGAFRLARTVTGSTAAAWISGIIFAFIPYRFHLLSHLHYLFTGWVPLTIEALVLFVRVRSWRRAAWLGITVVMNGLTCLTWLLMTFIPLLLTGLFLVAIRRTPITHKDFWFRGGTALAIAGLVLLPFLLPYYYVSELYGFRWQEWEFAFNSPSLMHWLSAEGRNKFWAGFGDTIAGGHKLFPGLLPVFLAVAAFRVSDSSISDEKRWLGLPLALDLIILASAILAVLALGYLDLTFSVFGYQIIRLGRDTPFKALVVILVLITFRVGLLIARLHRMRQNPRSSELFNRWQGENEILGIGLIWTTWGFLASLGANFFVNQLLVEYILPFRGIRLPARWAMMSYIGLALLAGWGSTKLAGRLEHTALRNFAVLVVPLIAIGLVLELRAFPLTLVNGEVEPSALALRLKETPMKGGLVELPSEGGGHRHLYMLRAADHGKPLVNATASFVSPLTREIGEATQKTIRLEFLDLLESIPTSYLVIHNNRVPPHRRIGYERFIGRATAVGRLRFINRFDGETDLYAVVKTEPETQSEAELPFRFREKEWSESVSKEPLNLLGEYQDWSQALFRLQLALTGQLPKYEDLLRDVQVLGKGIHWPEEEQQLKSNFGKIAESWTNQKNFSQLDDVQFIDRILTNAELRLAKPDRDILLDHLLLRQETRANILSRVVFDERFIQAEQNRSEVVLHYFAYLRRNPGDPPDKDLQGLEYWLREVERHGSADLADAFLNSIEYKAQRGRR